MAEAAALQARRMEDRSCNAVEVGELVGGALRTE